MDNVMFNKPVLLFSSETYHFQVKVTIINRLKGHIKVKEYLCMFMNMFFHWRKSRTIIFLKIICAKI